MKAMLRPLTWLVLLAVAVGGTLANEAIGGGAWGYLVVLLGGMFLASLTDLDGFYARDVTHARHRRGSRPA